MKNKIIFFLLPILTTIFLVFMSACQKSQGPDRSHVGGRVLELGTNEPIPGAEVHISSWSGSIGGGGSGGTSVLAATTHSNSDGYYDFDNLDGNSVLLVNATKEGYFTDLDTEEIVLDDGNYDDIDISLPPHAWLRVTIRNESGAYAFNTDVFDPEHPFIYLSANADTILTLLVKGNQEYRFGYCIKPTPVTLTGCIWLPIFCPGHDTTKVTITY